jgi:hypothetical protein
MISKVSIHFLVAKVANVPMVTDFEVSKYTALAGTTLQYDSESWTLKEQNKSGNEICGEDSKTDAV